MEVQSSFVVVRLKKFKATSKKYAEMILKSILLKLIIFANTFLNNL